MTTVTEALSGKTHGDENFPVASWLLSDQNRGPILAFYRFVRAADDVADHPTLPPDRKLALLDGLDAALRGRGAPIPEAEPLRLALSERDLKPTHALDLLDAFRLDVAKESLRRLGGADGLLPALGGAGWPFRSRRSWRGPTTWPASDALCAALQVINHLQDCALDYRAPRSRLPAAGHPRRASRFGRDAGRAARGPGPARRHRRDRPPHKRVDRSWRER